MTLSPIIAEHKQHAIIDAYPDAYHRVPVTDARVQKFTKLLVKESVLRNGWLWVEHASDELVAATRTLWAITAPGWLRHNEWDVAAQKYLPPQPASDDHIRALLAHSGIVHHLSPLGLRVLTPATAKAHRALLSHPSLAEKRITACYLSGGGVRTGTLAELWMQDRDALLHVARQDRILDPDAFDDDQIVMIPVLRGGQTLRDYILASAKD